MAEYNPEARIELQSEPLNRDSLVLLINRITVPVRDDRITNGSARLQVAESAMNVLGAALEQGEESRAIPDVLDELPTKTVRNLQSAVTKGKLTEVGDTFGVRAQAEEVLAYERQTKVEALVAKVKRELYTRGQEANELAKTRKLGESHPAIAKSIAIGGIAVSGVGIVILGFDAIKNGDAISWVLTLADLNALHMTIGMTMDLRTLESTDDDTTPQESRAPMQEAQI